MHNKTKIVVLHMKELIYTAIFVTLAVLFVILMVYMFSHKNSSEVAETMAQSTYVPGVYTLSLMFNQNLLLTY